MLVSERKQRRGATALRERRRAAEEASPRLPRLGPPPLPSALRALPSPALRPTRLCLSPPNPSAAALIVSVAWCGDSSHFVQELERCAYPFPGQQPARAALRCRLPGRTWAGEPHPAHSRLAGYPGGGRGTLAETVTRRAGIAGWIRGEGCGGGTSPTLSAWSPVRACSHGVPNQGD